MPSASVSFDLCQSALFLDFDGTLVEFCDHPDAVTVSADLRDLLNAVRDAAGGALAIVSGRRLESLDRLLSPLELPAAGLHGLERRTATGERADVAVGDCALGVISAELKEFCRTRTGTLVEEKGQAVALHYRRAPAHAAAALELAEQLQGRLPDGHVLVRGHDVVEIRPDGADKGTAIAAFMDEAPFAGRRPVFIGDDTTDEAGFTRVNALGGVSVKVGRGESAASERLSDPAAVHAWLVSLCA